jgi:hypothetical protein
MAIERNLPSKTLEEIMQSIQVNPTEPENTTEQAEVGEVAMLPTAAGDATKIGFIDL